MSLFHLIRASREHLRDNLTALTNPMESVKIMPDERPSPKAGNEFIALVPRSWHAFELQPLEAIHEQYDLTVAITRRTGSVPFDRIGEQIFMEDETLYDTQYLSMEERAREIMDLLSQNRDLMAEAKNQLGHINGYLTTWFWQSTDAQPRMVGPEHFHSTGDRIDTGLVLTVNFVGATRAQPKDTFDAVERVTDEGTFIFPSAKRA